MWRKFDHLVVGAGFFGAVLAERLADHGRRVLVIDRRQHIGGNSWSCRDPQTGIEYHPYGPHIFHTSDASVFAYLSRFARLNHYRHRIFTWSRGTRFPFPINLEVINRFFGKNLSPDEARLFIAEKCAAETCLRPGNLEEKSISFVGRELYEAFIKGYTAKQWGREPRLLPAEIITRIPFRYDNSRDYFPAARWQGIPEEGYAPIFKRMLGHKNIRIESNIDFHDIKTLIKCRREIIYSGPIDGYFHAALGPLDWRSVRFIMQRPPVPDYQEAAVINYADEHIPYTRIHEPRHFHPERNYRKAQTQTLVIEEYPDENPREPYYPVRTAVNLARLKNYQALAGREAPHTVFGGRLGEYAYLDMDKTIASALRCAKSLLAT